MIRRLVFSILVGLFFAGAAFVLAQEAAPVKPSLDSTIALLISGVAVVVIPWVTWGIARLAPKIPRASLPFVVWSLGTAADYITQLATGQAPMGAAGITAGALILRAAIHSLSQHGLKGGGGAVVTPLIDQPIVRKQW